jgi:hypothetical protein
MQGVNGLCCAVHVIMLGETRSAYRILAEKSLGKNSVGRPTRGRDDNVTMVLGICDM